MARTGKIARLPFSVREELNARLRDNENGQTVLAWLNALPICQERINAADGWKGEPVSDANLSLWRAEGGGYQEWLRGAAKCEFVSKLSQSLADMSAAGGNRMARNSLPTVIGELHRVLEEGQNVSFDDAGKPVLTGLGVDKLGKTFALLATAEQTDDKLAQNDRKLALEEAHKDMDLRRLVLDEKKFNHARVKSFAEWSQDEQAKDIATSDMPNDAKLEALGLHLFGEAW